MSVQWIVAQLAAVPAPEPKRAPYNPRPPGQIQPGSATEAVFAFLQRRPSRLHRHYEIEHAVARSRAAISWALLYLAQQGLIESVADGTRNPRYRRYRVAPTPTNEPR